jgi:hypothetical protein
MQPRALILALILSENRLPPSGIKRERESVEADCSLHILRGRVESNTSFGDAAVTKSPGRASFAFLTL